MSIGAGIGFISGIAFTVISAVQFGETAAQIEIGLVVVMPITVMMGTLAGWLWDIFIKARD